MIYGYAWGGSGGAFKTISGFENTDVWDGVSTLCHRFTAMAIPNVFTVRIYAMRMLWDKFPSILDAVEPGGSGDMYRDLDPEQRAALQEVTRMGFPPTAWFDYKTLGRARSPSYSISCALKTQPTFKNDFGLFPAIWVQIRRSHCNRLGFSLKPGLRRSSRLAMAIRQLKRKGVWIRPGINFKQKHLWSSKWRTFRANL